MYLDEIQQDLQNVLMDYFQVVKFPKDSIFVVGCSTSEILGRWKGTNSSLKVGFMVFDTIRNILKERNINIAIQGCEHINRALLVERKVAEQNNLEFVSVVPSIHAGGGTQIAGYERMNDPVEVEHIEAFGGIDIGGTEIGMHIKFVQIPIRTMHNNVGEAKAVLLSSRPKLIGGVRARYDFSAENECEHTLKK
ncbi:UPF0340 protein [Lentilactobacillus fungorum]|uniref:UPF0340 protein YK48G_13620 n=1 Tax=Lentilactobacillus fungorum TaxID=2201250 RepID=A0ABQ3W0D5_9LACO|nr:TIGR01440 family protein [Lentilactobacillus fungorum]GHP13937.1 UPF0340 protein [Lentilactobacillus fungorum]